MQNNVTCATVSFLWKCAVGVKRGTKQRPNLSAAAEKINQNNNFKNTGKQLFFGKSYLQKNLLWMKTPENMWFVKKESELSPNPAVL